MREANAELNFWVLSKAECVANFLMMRELCVDDVVVDGDGGLILL